MKKTIAIIIIFTGVLYNPSPIYSWGFFAHKLINKMAVFTLPPEMINFYKKNIDYIAEHAVDPDKRRYGVEGEAEKHYIDVDYYGKDPFKTIPKFWKSAVEKFTEDTLRAYGIVPWHIEKMVFKLTEAFKEEDYEKIIQLSAELGHYVGDAHVPLHTTENYNGQLTNQKGIHGFWESRIPELKAMNYDFFIGRAKMITKLNDRVWSYIKVSHYSVDTVLFLERELSKKYSPDQKYCIESKGAITTRVYCEAYTEDYDKLLNGMVERRMRDAIKEIGSLWYTAWVNAGQPDLSRLMDKELSLVKQQELKKEEELWEKGKTENKIKGKGHED